MPNTFPPESPYRKLAHSLDALPNGYPPAADGSDLRLLARLFTPEEAALAADLLSDLETPGDMAERLSRDPQEVRLLLKEMSRKGLVAAGKTAEGQLGFGILPFVVGIYEAQAGRIDATLAQLFESYYRQAFGTMLAVQPQVHRVIPVGESIKNDMEVQPFESVSGLIEQARAWGVLDCICRTQKALIGDPCKHPVDVCMVLSQRPGAFDNSSTLKALTREEAYQTLQRAARAGLVHCVSNHQRDIWYICNCCTCSCGILRGMAELGIANVVARSAFVNRVDADLCIDCGDCVTACQFRALSLGEFVVQVNEMRCTGCGVCNSTCPQGALSLVRRPDAAFPPMSEKEWGHERLAARQAAQ